MRLFVIFWAAVEVLQVAVIAALAVGYRKLQRRVDQEHNFSRNPPPSVTEGKS